MNRLQRNNRLHHGVKDLVKIETAYAGVEHGAHYHSPAEGYAIIREEALEITAETDGIFADLTQLDTAIRAKDAPEHLTQWTKHIQDAAIRAAIEAVHVAAAAEKLTQSIKDAPNKYFAKDERK